MARDARDPHSFTLRLQPPMFDITEQRDTWLVWRAHWTAFLGNSGISRLNGTIMAADGANGAAIARAADESEAATAEIARIKINALHAAFSTDTMLVVLGLRVQSAHASGRDGVLAQFWRWWENGSRGR